MQNIKLYAYPALTTFSQICKISPTVSLCVCVCVFVCVCVCACVCVCVCAGYFREHRSYLSENKKNVKKTFVDFGICHRMASLQKIYSVTVT